MQHRAIGNKNPYIKVSYFDIFLETSKAAFFPAAEKLFLTFVLLRFLFKILIPH